DHDSVTSGSSPRHPLSSSCEAGETTTWGVHSQSVSSYGDLLRQYRRELGLTQEALAERAGLSEHGIQKLERGVTQPYRDTAQRLEVALQLGPDDQARLRAAMRPARRYQGAPARNPGTSPHNGLPAPRTSFVGRAW